MNIKRKAEEILNDWRTSRNRKPLLIRGARQVGKTTLVRNFAGNFETYVELNLEREADKRIFENDDVDKVINAAYLLKKVIPLKNSTLFFIDEIQEYPKAIKLIRYFYEEKPELYVISAGSLLEFALGETPGFPVGRINNLYLHPLNFQEYLEAVGNFKALEAFQTVPVPEFAHYTLLEMFHEYAIIGGMPEIVRNFLEDKNFALLSGYYKMLWQSYKDDVEKYAKNDSEKKIIRHVIETAPYEKDRIKFEGFGNSRYRSREIGEALRSLDLARIIRLIYPTTSLKPPIITDYKKRPRLQFLDTGMLNQILLWQKELILLKNLDDFHNGKVIQHLIGQELISIEMDADYKPHFWVKETKQGNAEIDFVYQLKDMLIPIEVKSGKYGRLRSLHQYMELVDHPYAVRMYSGKFGVEKLKTIGGKDFLLMNLPYYLGTKIPEYLEYFVEDFKL